MIKQTSRVLLTVAARSVWDATLRRLAKVPKGINDLLILFIYENSGGKNDLHIVLSLERAAILLILKISSFFFGF